MEHMKLVQLVFMFLIINTKHGYSSETNVCRLRKAFEKERKTVEELQNQMVRLRNFYDKSYSQIIPIFLPEYSQFKITSELIRDIQGNKVGTLLQYNAILRDYRSAFDSFKRNHRMGISQLPITIENISNNLDTIIDCFKNGSQTLKSRFNRTEIMEKSAEHFKETPDLKNLQVKTIYAIIVQFFNFLSNVIRILSELLRLAPNET